MAVIDKANYFVLVPLAIAAVFLFQTIAAYVRLRHIPGPFLAKFTNIPRFSWVKSNRAHDIHIDLHRKYGRIVRYGPNMVAVSDPAEIGKIYGFGKGATWGKVGQNLARMSIFISSFNSTPVRFLPCSSHETKWEALARHLCYPGRGYPQDAQETDRRRLLDEHARIL